MLHTSWVCFFQASLSKLSFNLRKTRERLNSIYIECIHALVLIARRSSRDWWFSAALRMAMHISLPRYHPLPFIRDFSCYFSHLSQRDARSPDRLLHSGCDLCSRAENRHGGAMWVLRLPISDGGDLFTTSVAACLIPAAKWMTWKCWTLVAGFMTTSVIHESTI